MYIYNRSYLSNFRQTFKGRGFLGFGQNLVDNLPASLPELPIQHRDLRNSQKSLKICILIVRANQKQIPYILFHSR